MKEKMTCGCIKNDIRWMVLAQAVFLAAARWKGCSENYMCVIGTVWVMIAASYYFAVKAEAETNIVTAFFLLVTMGILIQSYLFPGTDALKTEYHGLADSSRSTQSLYNYLLKNGIFKYLYMLVGSWTAALLSALLYARIRVFFQSRRGFWAMTALDALLLMGVLFTGQRVGGAALSISIGGISFQPAEVIKILFVVMMANLHGGGYVTKKKAYLALAVYIFHVLGFIFCSEFGAVILLSVVWLFFLVFYTPQYTKEIIAVIFMAALIVGVLAGILVYGIGVSHKYTFCAADEAVKKQNLDVNAPLMPAVHVLDKVLSRIYFFMHPDLDPYGLGHQYRMLKKSLNLSGLTGCPEAMRFSMSEQDCDLVFAKFIQIFGFLGGVMVISAAVLLFFCMLRSAYRVQNQYHQAVAMGICILFGIEYLVHFLSSGNLFPIVGLGCPLLASGCSNLLLTMIGMGLFFVSELNGGEPRGLFC